MYSVSVSLPGAGLVAGAAAGGGAVAGGGIAGGGVGVLANTGAAFIPLLVALAGLLVAVGTLLVYLTHLRRKPLP